MQNNQLTVPTQPHQPPIHFPQSAPMNLSTQGYTANSRILTNPQLAGNNYQTFGSYGGVQPANYLGGSNIIQGQGYLGGSSINQAIGANYLNQGMGGNYINQGYLGASNIVQGQGSYVCQGQGTYLGQGATCEYMPVMTQTMQSVVK